MDPRNDIDMKELEKGEVSHAETKAVGNNGFEDRAGATEAETHQIEMTTRQALRFYWKSVIWSIIASTVIIMEGFDSLLGNFFVLQPFLKKYGDWNEELGKYVITADWQMGLTQAVSVGCIVGVIGGAWQVDRLGYRWSMISNLIALSGFIGKQAVKVHNLR